MDEIVDVNTMFGPMPFASSDLTVDILLALMEKHGVKRACILSTLGMLLDAAGGNGATRAACGDHPGLLPVATFNPTTYFGDAAPMQRLQAEGFCLTRFFPAQQGWPIQYAPFRALVDAMHPSAMPIMIGVGRAGEITALASVLSDYTAPVILSGVDYTLLAEAIAVLRRHENWHIETSRLLAPGCIPQVVATVGAERLLFGTGAPAYPIASALHTLQYAALSEEQRLLILSGNARRIMQLPA